jgi:hypothetical protein
MNINIFIYIFYFKSALYVYTCICNESRANVVEYLKQRIEGTYICIWILTYLYILCILNVYYICVYTCICIESRANVVCRRYICIYIYVLKFICIYLYVYIYTHIHKRIHINLFVHFFTYNLGIADPNKRAATAIKIAEKLGVQLCIFSTQNWVRIVYSIYDSCLCHIIRIIKISRII